MKICKRVPFFVCYFDNFIERVEICSIKLARRVVPRGWIAKSADFRRGQSRRRRDATRGHLAIGIRIACVIAHRPSIVSSHRRFLLDLTALADRR